MVRSHHETFARALVKLCRAHGVYSISAEFRQDGQGAGADISPQEAAQTVRASWARGRHGAAASINITTQGYATIGETEAEG